MNRAFVKWHPIGVLVIYGALISEYRQHLDGHLQYVRPALPSAPEDILGLGLWVPWLVISLWFCVACAMSFLYGHHRTPAYWSALLLGFGILTITDFYLYRIIERGALGF